MNHIKNSSVQKSNIKPFSILLFSATCFSSSAIAQEQIQALGEDINVTGGATIEVSTGLAGLEAGYGGKLTSDGQKITITGSGQVMGIYQYGAGSQVDVSNVDIDIDGEGYLEQLESRFWVLRETWKMTNQWNSIM